MDSEIVLSHCVTPLPTGPDMPGQTAELLLRIDGITSGYPSSGSGSIMMLRMHPSSIKLKRSSFKAWTLYWSEVMTHTLRKTRKKRTQNNPHKGTSNSPSASASVTSGRDQPRSHEQLEVGQKFKAQRTLYLHPISSAPHPMDRHCSGTHDLYAYYTLGPMQIIIDRAVLPMTQRL